MPGGLRRAGSGNGMDRGPPGAQWCSQAHRGPASGGAPRTVQITLSTRPPQAPEWLLAWPGALSPPGPSSWLPPSGGVGPRHFPLQAAVPASTEVEAMAGWTGKLGSPSPHLGFHRPCARLCPTEDKPSPGQPVTPLGWVDDCITEQGPCSQSGPDRHFLTSRPY